MTVAMTIPWNIVKIRCMKNVHHKHTNWTRMKYLVAFVVIASVAAGNLRALEHDDTYTGAFVEMKENSSNRELAGNETEMVIRNETQRALTRFNRPNAIAGDVPTYEVQEKEHTDADENVSDPDFDVRIVGGEVSDSNEFPYYGTSFWLPARLYIVDMRDPWLSISTLSHRSELVWVRCDVDWTRYCYWCCSLRGPCRANGLNRYRPTGCFCATPSPQLQQQHHAERLFSLQIEFTSDYKRSHSDSQHSRL